MTVWGNRFFALVGVGAAGLTMSPLASQQSESAALEAACRATEVTAPASCACTVEQSRVAGLNTAQLTSLFRDDGHSDPVDQQVYSRFWQIKSQCIANAMMAQLGVSPGTPLPGVPAHMRPGAPLGGAPASVPAQTPAANPRADGTYVAQLSRAARPQPPVSTQLAGRAPASVTARADAGCDGSAFAGRDDVIVCGDTGVLETVLLYDRALDEYPALLGRLKSQAEATFADMSRGRTTRDRYAYVVAWNLASVNGQLVSITGLDGDTSRGRLGGSSALLWDDQRQQVIGWSDVFEPGVWQGRIRRDYCTALRARFAEHTEPGSETYTGCPQLADLTISIADRDGGSKALSFSAPVGVIASYASSALYDGIELPIDAALLAAVKPPYREALSGAIGGAQAGALPPLRLSDRMGAIEQVLAGDIQASDDFFFLPSPTPRLRTMRDFDTVMQTAHPMLFMTLYEGDDDNWGYSIMLDGRQHNLSQQSFSNGQSVYSDGTVQVTIQKGERVSDTFAFGYSLDRITVTKGEESDIFEAINFGGA